MSRKNAAIAIGATFFAVLLFGAEHSKESRADDAISKTFAALPPVPSRAPPAGGQCPADEWRMMARNVAAAPGGGSVDGFSVESDMYLYSTCTGVVYYVEWDCPVDDDPRGAFGCIIPLPLVATGGFTYERPPNGAN